MKKFIVALMSISLLSGCGMKTEDVGTNNIRLIDVLERTDQGQLVVIKHSRKILFNGKVSEVPKEYLLENIIWFTSCDDQESTITFFVE